MYINYELSHVYSESVNMMAVEQIIIYVHLIIQTVYSHMCHLSQNLYSVRDVLNDSVCSHQF
jgi:hypothetical protein